MVYFSFPWNESSEVIAAIEEVKKVCNDLGRVDVVRFIDKVKEDRRPFFTPSDLVGFIELLEREVEHAEVILAEETEEILEFYVLVPVLALCRILEWYAQNEYQYHAMNMEGIAKTDTETLEMVANKVPKLFIDMMAGDAEAWGEKQGVTLPKEMWLRTAKLGSKISCFVGWCADACNG